MSPRPVPWIAAAAAAAVTLCSSPTNRCHAFSVPPPSLHTSLHTSCRTPPRLSPRSVPILPSSPALQATSGSTDNNDGETKTKEEQKLASFEADISSKYRDLSSDSFGPLLPVAEKVDSLTNGWGLSYADLHPETPQTKLGVAFLATNACYAVGGLALGVRGEWTLGALTEIAGIVSFWYHYSQLEFGQDRREVRLALLVDYMTAGTALITGGVYMVTMGIGAVPPEALVWGLASVLCLTLCWVREFGYWYLFWHSLWHVFSAYTGFLVGQAHISSFA